MNIKELAEQAGMHIEENWVLQDGVFVTNVTFIERFAELVAAAEREACAKHYVDIMRDAVEQAVAKEREACAKIVDENLFLLVAAAAIRARGEK